MLREGTVSVIRYEGDRFDVVFCRNDWGGILSPHKLTGREAVVDFLHKELAIRKELAKDALLETDRKGTAEIPRVQRNEAVHPNAAQVTPGKVQLSLSAFPHACQKIYDLIAWLNANSI